MRIFKKLLTCNNHSMQPTRRYGSTLHKNRHLEEWNGMRETSEKRFQVDSSLLPNVLLTIVLPFWGIYTISKQEMVRNDTLNGKPNDPDRYL